MRIAVFIKRTTYHKGFGGLETQNKILCEGLVKKGHQVTVFSPKYELTHPELSSNGVRYIFIDCTYGANFGFAFLNKNNWLNKSAEIFEQYLKSERFDVVLGQSSAALGILRKFRIPVVSISHGTILGEFTTQLQNLNSLKDYARLVLDFGYVMYNFFGRQREFVTHSKRVIAVSNFVKNALIEETYVPESRVTVIYNGIDPKDFPNINEIASLSTSSDKNFKLVFVGRIHPSKGLGDLFKALSLVLKRNPEFNNKLSLTVVGTGESAYLAELKTLADTLSLSKNIVFTGNKPHNEVKEILSNSTVFVLPSRRKEGFPMTLVEAMLVGLPVIGANIGGISEAIVDKVTGRIYESGNIDGLSECISDLMENSEMCNRMSKEAQNKALAEFTLDVMLSKYEKILNEVQHNSNMKGNN